MASEEQSREKGGQSPSDPLTIPFQWGAVLSAVKDQIPSMDSDIPMSDCDDDGELFIFQRDEANLIPDLSEELEQLSADEADLQRTFMFMRHPREPWNEDLGSSVFPTAEGASRPVCREQVLLGRDDCDEKLSQQTSTLSVFLTNGPQSGEGLSGVIGEKGLRPGEGQAALSSSADLLSVEASPVLNTSEKERRRLIETQILSKVILGLPSEDVVPPPPSEKNSNLDKAVKVESKPGAIAAEHPRELSLFAFKDIEKWDLDKILQGLEKQDDDRSWAAEIAFPSTDHETCRARSHAWLMGKLEELCLEQSRAFFSHRRRRLAKLPHFNECRGDGRDVPIPAPVTNGQSPTPVELQGRPEPPTIYIDLRDAASQSCAWPADEKQSSSNSSTDEEEDTEVTSREPAREGTREPSRPSRNDCTGKSFLLQQLRHFRRQVAQNLSAAQDRESNPNLKKPEEKPLPNARRRQHLKWRGLASAGPASLKSKVKDFLLLDHINSMARPSEELQEESETRPSAGSPPESPEGKNAGYPRARESQKEQHIEEKRKKEKLLEQLERSKPQRSVTGKQPMGEQTPVLFHTEASFLAPIKTRPPPEGPRREQLLLTIGLSSCTQVALCSQGHRPFPEASLPAASIYAVVVAWLLSLVSAREESKAPFQVLGLQQAWHEGGLALHACIAPANKGAALNDGRLQARQVKEFLPETSLFHQQTSLFLSRTPLSDVIWWKEELANQMRNQAKYPFLPEIPAIHLSDITTLSSDLAAVEQAFAVPAGFYWQTVETEEEYFSGGSPIGESSGLDTEVALALLFETLLGSPVAVHHLLQLILASGLDICGLRLLYPQCSTLLSSMVPLPSCYAQVKVPGVLALSLRGANARSVLQDIMGPSDPQLAIVTDCCSVNAIYCASRAEPLAYLPHTEHRVHRELCAWFGGRVCCEEMLGGGVPNPLCKYDKARLSSLQADSEKSVLQDSAPPRLPATLVCTTKGDVVLVASPAVPSRAYGAVISACTRRGFVLQGLKRLRLPPKQALLLCLPASQEAVFCPPEAPCPQDRSVSGDHLAIPPPVHCLAVLLRKENATHHVPALLKGLMNGLAEKGFLEDVQRHLHTSGEPEPGLCFHVIPYTDSALQALGGSFSSVPDPCTVPLGVSCHRSYASHPETEQIVLLTLSGQEAMKSAGSFLHQILALGTQKQAPVAVPEEFGPRFELLALKWLPHLTWIQAKEISPFEVGDKSWQASVARLMSGPALVCALRGIGAFAALTEILKTFAPCDGKPGATSCSLRAVMSLTPEMAFRQAVLFFTKKDFVDDPKSRPGLKYLPPPGRPSQRKAGETQRSHAESLFHYMQGGAPLLCTVLLIKPGVWARNLARFLRKLDQEKFCLVGMKHVTLDPQDVRALLSAEAQQDPAVVEAHSSYLTSGSSLVLCLQRENAVKKLLDLLGPEDPKQARAISQFLWRAQYGLSSTQNGFYGSVAYAVALRDVKRFFPEGLCGAERSTLAETEICTAAFDPVACLEIHKRRRLVKCQVRSQPRFLGSERPPTLERPPLAVLCQSTCLIFPEVLLRGAGRPPYLELLEQLISKDFLVTGARLTTMSQSQACFISGILNATERESSATCSRLAEGPCLVLAAQRDNAVLCFGSLLPRDYSQKRALLDPVKHLLYPKTEKQAEELLCCLFDSLTSDSICQIETPDS